MGLGPDRAAMHAELLGQRGDAQAVGAGCSHSVHFALRQACSRSSTWFRRRADQRVVRLSGGGVILAGALIPRGSEPLDPLSHVPVVVDGAHRTSDINPRSPHELTIIVSRLGVNEGVVNPGV